MLSCAYPHPRPCPSAIGVADYLQLSEGDAKKDPLTLWMNGGPGCTSLKGGFEELGQLVFNRDSLSGTGTPTLEQNPYSWTKLS